MAAPLSDLERLTIRVALEDLNTAFCHHLDHNEVDALLELFVDEVYYTHGSRVSRSKAELKDVFRNRSATETRTARHLYSGLKLDIESAARARGTCVCMTFAAYGEPPLSPAQRLYQRLLAFDYNEPVKLARNYLKSAPLEKLYDEIVIPALILAERDRHAGLLNDDQEAFVHEAADDLVEELGQSDGAETAASTEVSSVG